MIINMHVLSICMQLFISQTFGVFKDYFKPAALSLVWKNPLHPLPLCLVVMDGQVMSLTDCVISAICL